MDLRAQRRLLVACLCFLAWLGQRLGPPVPAAADAPLAQTVPGAQVHVLGVGDGQAVLATCDGVAALIGAGPEWAGPAVAAYVRREGLTELEAIILASDWERHVGGVADVLSLMGVGAVYDAVPTAAGESHRRALEAAARLGIPYERLRAGQRLWLGCLELRILAPVEGVPSEEQPAPPLTAGGVFLLTAEGQGILYAGNLDQDGERSLVRVYPDLRIEGLIVGRGGHKAATSALLLEQLQPRLAIIPVGSYNEEGRPHAEVLERLEAVGAQIYRTDRDGTVIVSLTPLGLRVRTRPPLLPGDRVEVEGG